MSRPTLSSSMCRRCQTRLVLTPSSRHQQQQGQQRPRFLSATAPTRKDAFDDFSVFEQALGKSHTRSPRRAPSQTATPGGVSNNTNNNNDNYRPFAPKPSSSSPSSTSSSSFAQQASSSLDALAQSARSEASTRPSTTASETEPYHLNVYAHKHNTHLTFTEPSRNPILSYSAGNIGLRKAQRGTFDAAYQLSTYTMRKMAEKQWRIGGKNMTTNRMLTLSERDVRERGIEVILRGYGPGREAFQKALLGTEGKMVKPLVRKVTDGTRLKFGGTRSPQVRRLG